jgi:hypothetical protein
MNEGRAMKTWLRAWTVALLCAAAAASQAQSADADPPGRVGRIGQTQGQVWIYGGDVGEWIAAARNRPVTTGDRIATDGAGKAEIDIGSTTLLLDGGTEIEIARLDDEAMHVELHDGSVAARLRSGEAAREFELLTAEARFRPDRAGLYRHDRIDERTQVTVLRGQGLLQGEGSAVTVTGGQRAEMWRDGGTQYSLTEPVRDAFAAWVQERDRADARSASTRYVSPEMTGVDDLDRHGRWEQSDEYGALWVPRVVVAGWAPYRYGHWVFMQPWGWTWVDDAPWGFAPFHYGRWVHVRNRWCWAPGRWVARPVYAPALVGWIGGPHVSVTIGIGAAPTVGWFPLAPRETYVPGYRVSVGYVHKVNHSHVTHVQNVTTIVHSPGTVVQRTNYANRRLDHAVTFVPTQVMTSRQPVGGVAWNARDPRSRDWSRAPVMPAAPVTAPPVRGGGEVRVVPGRGEVRVAPPPPMRAVPRERVVQPPRDPGASPSRDPGVRPGVPPRGAPDGSPDFGRAPRQPLPMPSDPRPELGRVPRPDPVVPMPAPVPRAVPPQAMPNIVAPQDRGDRGDRDRGERFDRGDRGDRIDHRPAPLPKQERREFPGQGNDDGPRRVVPAPLPAPSPQPMPERREPRGNGHEGARPAITAPAPAAMPAARPQPQMQAPPQPQPQLDPGRRSAPMVAPPQGREGRGGDGRESRGGRGERG